MSLQMIMGSIFVELVDFQNRTVKPFETIPLYNLLKIKNVTH